MNTPSHLAPTFADFFSFPAFQAFLAHERRTDLSDGKSGEIFRALLQRSMTPALARFIDALRDAGRLSALSGTAGRRGNLMDAWNGALSDGDDRQLCLDTVADRLALPFLFRIVYDAAEREADPVTDRAAYEALIQKVDGGTITWRESVEDYCFVSGDQLKGQMASWKLQLGQIKDRGFVPIQDISIAPVAECEVQFESGELLIADWFRIEAFTRAVRASEDPAHDINSLKGCLARTEEYALKQGFVSVMVSNSSPSVFAEDGTLVIGRADEDAADAPSPLGMIITDLWWVTIIDRKRLTDIVATEIGAEAAASVVSQYLADHEVLTLQVTPGFHRLYFSGEPEAFTENFHSPDLDVNSAIEPMFVLSPRPLQLMEKPAPALPTP